jgi:FkbM family methyltransferase
MILDLRESVCIPLFVQGSYAHQVAEDDFVKAAVERGACVFDIGANIGYYTRLLSRIVGEQGVVVAVEPMPRALRLLQRNAADLSNTRIFPAAIGESTSLQADLHEAKQLDVSTVSFGSGSTPVVTIDSLAKSVRPPSFIKIDIEGAEVLALRGATRVLSEIRPILMFEYIPHTAVPFGALSLQDLIACFSAGYSFFRISNPLRLLPVNSTDSDTNNYAAIPCNKIAMFSSFIGPC